MIGLLQRITDARVDVNGETIGAVGRGLLVLVGIQKGDSKPTADRLLERLLGYRVFPDDKGKMNLNLVDIEGGLLLVPQFTLAADTHKGTRPSFSSAAEPELSRELFDYLLRAAQAKHSPVGSGKFGADMAVTLTNDGPVTFWLEVAAETATDSSETKSP